MSEEEILSPFGPSILKTRFSDSIRLPALELVDEILSDPLSREILYYGNKLAGHVDSEVRFPIGDRRVQGLLDFILSRANRFHEEATDHLADDPREGHRFEIHPVWFVRQLEKDWNPRHFHDGVLGAVAYLRIPEKMTEIKRHKSVPPGHLELFDGNPSPYRRFVYRALPKEGDLFIFPAWMLHDVFPFYGEGERVSIACNIRLSPN